MCSPAFDFRPARSRKAARMGYRVIVGMARRWPARVNANRAANCCTLRNGAWR